MPQVIRCTFTLYTFSSLKTLLSVLPKQKYPLPRHMNVCKFIGLHVYAKVSVGVYTKFIISHIIEVSIHFGIPRGA